MALEIFVNVLSGPGNTLTLLVEQSDTIGALKSKIQLLEGILIARQRLVFDGFTLENELTISKSDIQEQSTIFLVICTQISIFLVTGEDISLDVKLSSDSIECVKRMIAKREGVPVDQQCLLFEGKELQDNSSTLSEYNISSDSVLQLLTKGHQVISYKLFIQTPLQKTITLHLEPTDTITDVKIMIRGRESIPVNQQCLVFNGRPLQDDITLADYQIYNNGTIHLLFPLRTGVHIFLTGQSSMPPSHYSKFNISDRVILRSMKGDVISGKVRWAGQVQNEDKFIAMVGIETVSAQ